MLSARKRGVQSSAAAAVTIIHDDDERTSFLSNNKSNRPNNSRKATLVLACCALFMGLGVVLGVGVLYYKNVRRTGASEKLSSNSVVTVVIPSVVDVPHRKRRLKAILETWAHDAHALIVVHNMEEEYPTEMVNNNVWSLDDNNKEPVDTNSYPQVLNLPPSITIKDEHGFDRLAFVIRHVYNNHASADFIFLVNDHTYVIPEHLCHYLQDFSKEEDLYAGRAMKNPGIVFNSGAAGYLLSRTTMKRLLDIWDTSDTDGSSSKQQCQPTHAFHRSNPDLVVAECLQNVLHVPAVDTRAAGKYHRFHSYGLVRTVQNKTDDWFVKVHTRFQNMTGFDESYQTLLTGPDCCAADGVSFHYVEAVETLALHRIRQLLLEQDMTDEELRQHLNWPTRDLGGYSAALPVDNNPQVVQNVMTVLRKMSRKDLQMKC